jgi:hypothetical protein
MTWQWQILNVRLDAIVKYKFWHLGFKSIVMLFPHFILHGKHIQ